MAKPKQPEAKAVASAAQRRSTATGLKQLLAVDAEVAKAHKEARDADDHDNQEELERTANRAFLVSLDNQLQKGVGLHAMMFVPRVRLRALSAHEERYFVEVECPLLGEGRRRSCIKDTRTGKGRYELPLQIVKGVRVNNIWHVVLDMGSIGDPAIIFSFAAWVRKVLRHGIAFTEQSTTGSTVWQKVE